eukprot:GHVS01100817.1.p1 GENE.GHVS01100817.1~~GHVS01100817.1.p1  ORF type:complete len:722 (+),score=138.84 GHVS01100817.1:67-2232(+)
MGELLSYGVIFLLMPALCLCFLRAQFRPPLQVPRCSSAAFHGPSTEELFEQKKDSGQSYKVGPSKDQREYRYQPRRRPRKHSHYEGRGSSDGVVHRENEQERLEEEASYRDFDKEVHSAIEGGSVGIQAQMSRRRAQLETQHARYVQTEQAERERIEEPKVHYETRKGRETEKGVHKAEIDLRDVQQLYNIKKVMKHNLLDREQRRHDEMRLPLLQPSTPPPDDGASSVAGRPAFSRLPSCSVQTLLDLNIHTTSYSCGPMLPEQEDVVGTTETSQIDDANPENTLMPPPPPEDATYDALVLLKGLPFTTRSEEVEEWFRPFRLAHPAGVSLLSDKLGQPTGDAYVRFANARERDKAIEGRRGKFYHWRVMKLFRATPTEYEQYYLMGYRQQPCHRNSLAPQLLLSRYHLCDGLQNQSNKHYVRNHWRVRRILRSQEARSQLEGDEDGVVVGQEDGGDAGGMDLWGEGYREEDDDEEEQARRYVGKNCDVVDLGDLQTGMCLEGLVVRMAAFGCFVDCGVSVAHRWGGHRRLWRGGLLHRAWLPRNIGLASDEARFNMKKEFLLEVGMLINVFVGETVNHQTWDHNEAHQKYSLTLDASVTAEKIHWFREKKLRYDQEKARVKEWEERQNGGVPEWIGSREQLTAQEKPREARRTSTAADEMRKDQSLQEGEMWRYGEQAQEGEQEEERRSEQEEEGEMEEEHDTDKHEGLVQTNRQTCSD